LKFIIYSRDERSNKIDLDRSLSRVKIVSAVKLSQLGMKLLTKEEDKHLVLVKSFNDDDLWRSVKDLMMIHGEMNT